MNRFRDDNTEGYAAAELAALNAAFAELTDGEPNDRDDTPIHDRKSWCDYVGETILFAFDQGHRGEDLLRAVRPAAEEMRYSVPAPVFDSVDQPADIVGQALTAEEAMAIYRDYFAGTGLVATRAIKICPEILGRGPVDGWAPVTAE